MKILCFTPLHPDYGIRLETLSGIMALKHDDVLDRHLAEGDNPFDKPFENVLHQHNKARKLMLDNGYDALLSIEADMIVPLDTIAKLIDANADIAYGLYLWRHKPRRWSAYTELTLWGGTSVSYNHNGKEARAAWGTIIDVVGLGMGCTLIGREVLKAIPFRLHDGKPGWIADEYADEFRTLGIDPYRERNGMVCDDWLLAMDAQHYGFTQRANLGLVCGHISEDSVFWPDPHEKELYRIERR